MNQFYYFALSALSVIILAGCGDTTRGAIISPGIDKRQITWSDAEKNDVFIIKKLQTFVGNSTHAARVNGKSDARIHDMHDMTVSVLSGSLHIRLAGKWLTAQAGDVIEIPRGSSYEFDRRGSQAAELYMSYYPPFNGKDTRSAK
jgi:quercetin dioxygenase-like cupin family protein